MKKDDLKNTLNGREKNFKRGTKVRFIGESSWAFENGKIYEVVGYDEELEAYAVMSNVDIAYAVGPDDLEEI